MKVFSWQLRVAVVLLSCQVTAQPASPPGVLPATATTQLSASLEAARAHASHIWRDTPPWGASTITAYIEIARGDRRKWEFDMRVNARAIDRMIPERIGGYPVNYGFVPQTISYDGDPFDALVIGPAIEGGSIVRGAIIGLMHMEDEKGLDSKVVLSPIDVEGRMLYQLTEKDKNEIAEYFRKYKQGQPGMFSKVSGWGSLAEGRAYVDMTHAFFRDCRARGAQPCQLHK